MGDKLLLIVDADPVFRGGQSHWDNIVLDNHCENRLSCGCSAIG